MIPGRNKREMAWQRRKRESKRQAEVHTTTKRSWLTERIYSVCRYSGNTRVVDYNAAMVAGSRTRAADHVSGACTAIGLIVWATRVPWVQSIYLATTGCM